MRLEARVLPRQPAFVVYGPESNDSVVQLRKCYINKVILTGMLANLCVEAHLRELVG